MLIVLLLASENVLDHARTTTPTVADQIACAERFEQGFGLIQPGSIGWSEQHMDTRLAGLEEFRGFLAGMAGSIINDQVNATSPI